MILATITFALWYFLPAGVANATPVVVAVIPGLRWLDYPLDFFLTLRGRRMLGPHKTIRGALSGVLMGIVTAYCEWSLLPYILPFISSIPNTYVESSPLLFGALAGSGALLGDGVKSTVKRQLQIPAGAPWIPFDQLDYIAGGLTLLSLYIPIRTVQIITIIILWFIIHIVASRIGYALGIKETPW